MTYVCTLDSTVLVGSLRALRADTWDQHSEQSAGESISNNTQNNILHIDIICYCDLQHKGPLHGERGREGVKLN